jgi:hypothetical protein
LEKEKNETKHSKHTQTADTHSAKKANSLHQRHKIFFFFFEGVPMNGAAVGVEGAGDGTLATGTVREAVAQLYFSSSCDTHAREEANQYLLAFTNDPTTTNVCLQLLGDSLSVLSSVRDAEQDGTHCGRSKRTEHTIAFFAANVLRTKVLKGNVHIGENTAEHFINEVLRYASDFSTIDESVTRKLASVAATSAALSVKQQHHQNSGSDTDIALGIATNLIRFAGELASSALQSSNIRKQTCGIEILKAFAEAIEEDVKDGRTRTQLVERVCKPSSRDVLQLCSSVVEFAAAAPQSTISISSSNNSSNGSSSREMENAARNAVNACLECSRLWFEACAKESEATSAQQQNPYEQLFSPCIVGEAFPILFTNAAKFVSSMDDKRGEAALQFLIKMCTGAQSTDYTRERYANLELIKQLIHYATASENKPCFTSGIVASRVLQVFVALVERDVLTFTEDVDDDENKNVQLQAIQFVCALAEAFPKKTVEPFGDFCLMINTTKKDERIEPCREPLFERLFNVCCIATASRKPLSSNADEFSDDSADDEECGDENAKFREHVLADAFDTCHGALGGEKYIEIVSNLFQQSGNHFKAVDVALFTLIAAKYGVKEDISAGNARVVQFFTQIFASIASNDTMFVFHPRVIESSCKLIETYFPLTAMRQESAPTDLIVGILRFTLLAISLKESWRAASVAFRDVCGKLETKTARFRAEKFVEIINLATEAMDKIPIVVVGAPQNDAAKQKDEELSRACVEGLARVLRTMWVYCANDANNKFEVIKGLLMQVISPHIERLNRSVEQKNAIFATDTSNISPECLEALQARSIEICLALSRLGAIIRFLEPPPSLVNSSFSPPRNDLACLVLESVWSSIESILSPSVRATGVINVKNQAEREDEESVRAIEVLANFAVASKMRARDFSEHIFALLESSFASLMPGSNAAIHVMQCISSFLEAVCEPMPPYDLESASLSTKRSAARCLERVLSSPDAYQMRESGMYARAFYDVARTAILFAPSISLDTNTSSSSHVVFETLVKSLHALASPSSNCGVGDRRMILMGVASLWNTIMYPSERLVKSSATWQRCYPAVSTFSRRDQAQVIITRCVDVLFFQDECSCPRDCLRALAKMLRGALIDEVDEDGNSLQQHKLEFFLSLFRNSEKFHVNEELLKAAQVCVEIIQKGEISSQRFDSMLVDFAYICRSEADSDALRDYL